MINHQVTQLMNNFNQKDCYQHFEQKNKPLNLVKLHIIISIIYIYVLLYIQS